jgi:hypothetical protein
MEQTLEQTAMRKVYHAAAAVFGPMQWRTLWPNAVTRALRH